MARSLVKPWYYASGQEFVKGATCTGEQGQKNRQKKGVCFPLDIATDT
jgi:hypothetical protein